MIEITVSAAKAKAGTAEAKRMMQLPRGQEMNEIRETTGIKDKSNSGDNK